MGSLSPPSTRFTSKLSNGFGLPLLLFWISVSSFTNTEAFDALDPNGNITIKWDVWSWTPDGYIAIVTINNYQTYRHIQEPGWKLGWTWSENEVIWNTIGAQPTEQGNCSRYKGKNHNIPSSCKKNPTVVDLPPGTPRKQRVENCCRGGVVSSWAQDPDNALSAFQISVGNAGTNNASVKLPRNFTLQAPGPGYTCGPAKIVKPSKYITKDRRRVTQSMMTWQIICTYSQFLAQRTPSCCVSLSYNSKIADCPTCSCGCQNKTSPGSCVKSNSSPLASNHSQVQCTNHMCPIRVNWHVKHIDKRYWLANIKITNFDYRKNYTQWNLVVQHSKFENLTKVFHFNHKSLATYGSTNDTKMFWGIKSYNDVLMQAGPHGNVQSLLLFRKNNSSTLPLEKGGWAFPQRIYFNGDNCVMPPPDAYPSL